MTPSAGTMRLGLAAARTAATGTASAEAACTVSAVSPDRWLRCSSIAFCPLHLDARRYASPRPQGGRLRWASDIRVRAAWPSATANNAM